MVIYSMYCTCLLFSLSIDRSGQYVSTLIQSRADKFQVQALAPAQV